MNCSKCKKEIDANEAYEYRGAISCADHLEDVQEMRDFQRNEIMREEFRKTECFRCIDLGDSTIGRANREILKTRIEIASKESGRIKEYEGHRK